MSVEAETNLRLSYRAGERRVSLLVDKPKVVLGRQETCDIVLPGADVSRNHAEIRCEAGAWILRDLGSSNGTRVNRVPVTQRKLENGDHVAIGNYEIECELCQPARVEEGVAAVPEARLDMQDFNAVLAGVLADSRSKGLGGATFLDVRRPVASESGLLSAAPDARWVLQMLHGATHALMEHDELDPTLEQVVDLVFQHLPAERCFVMLYDHMTEALEPRIQRVADGRPSGPLRISRHIADLVVKSKQSVLVRDARSDARLMAAESIVSLEICSALCAPLYHKGRVGGLIYADRSSAHQTFSSTHLAVISILASISAAAVERAQLRENLERERRNRERLSRYHAPAVVERIVRTSDQEEGSMDAEERVVSVLFADISGFTPLAERLSPREVTAILNEIFQALTEEVFREGGTLDKFIGDAVMVFFGAPIPQPDHALRAVRAARGMLARLELFNAERGSAPPLGIRIGINTGPVVVGDVGAQQRRDYTVIGDTVNVASRLESSVAKVGQVAIGTETWLAVRDQFECRPLEPLLLKGKARPFQPYVVL